MYSCDPMAAPKYGLPSLVIFTSVSAKAAVALLKRSSLVTSQDFEALFSYSTAPLGLIGLIVLPTGLNLKYKGRHGCTRKYMYFSGQHI